ncbi:MAG: hypothetical protein WA894_00355 [Candidatus Acidiferrum sp.]
MTVVEGVEALTCTTTMKLEEALAARPAASVHEIEPMPPTVGNVGQVQPVGIVMDW